MYTNILAATDGSDIANEALQHAASLAKTLGARLTLVSVTPQTPAFAGPEIGWSIPASVYDEIRKANRERSQGILRAAVDKLRATGVEAATRIVEEAEPHDGILEAAGEIGADLIVMGSHGYRGLNRLILGSAASKVLSLAHVPVLIVKPQAAA
jgi:nucleotide-binding universal stress UspA family protein